MHMLQPQPLTYVAGNHTPYRALGGVQQSTYPNTYNGMRCHLKRVWMRAEIIRGPPLAPMTALRRPSEVTTIMGDMDDCGFLRGRMKLGLDGGRP